MLLGSTALKNILGNEYGITATRGKWMEKKKIIYMPTWHPAALLEMKIKNRILERLKRGSRKI